MVLPMKQLPDEEANRQATDANGNDGPPCVQGRTALYSSLPFVNYVCALPASSCSRAFDLLDDGDDSRFA